MPNKSCETQVYCQWLAGYLEVESDQIEHLFKDRMPIQFLITWSLFESDCWKDKAIAHFAKEITEKPGFKREVLLKESSHFHKRYQSGTLYKRITHEAPSNWIMEFAKARRKSFNDLKVEELVYMLLFVVKRFRNNIFHGNKGVLSWPNYRQEIQFCISVMQSILDLYKSTQTVRTAA